MRILMQATTLASTLFLATLLVAQRSLAESPPADLNQEIEGFLATYAATYNRQDYAGLLALWDKEAPSPIYMAEEIDPPMHGWDRINGYFARPGVLDGIRNEYTNVDAHYLAPDLAVATYRLRFDIQVKNMRPLSSWDRVMAVFRRKDGQWKLAAYAEAPMAPLTMVRKMAKNSRSMSGDEQKALQATLLRLMQESVPADFGQWLKDQRGKSAE